MDLAIMIYAGYLALGALALGLLRHFWRRRKQRILARVYSDFHIPRKPQGTRDTINDGFYCIMTKRGCVSGFTKTTGV